MSVKILNDENFENEVLRFDGISVVDFYADWCGPCKIMSQIIDKIAEENENINVGKVNVDSNQKLAEKYEIMSIPTIIIFKNGEVIKTFIGVTDINELQQFIM